MSARRATAVLAAAALVLHAGCATAPPASTAYQAALGNAAIAAAATDPEIRFEGFAHGRAEGALTGAGGAFLGCAAGLGFGTCAGPFCGAVVVVWLAICGTAAAVGGVAGAVASQDAATVRAAESALATAIAPATIQEAMRAQLQAAAAKHGHRPRAGADTVVEVGLVRAGTLGAGFDSPLVLSMVASARVLRAADGAELHRAELAYEGPARRLTDWSAEGGQPLADALAQGYERLGEALYDAVFRLYPFPEREFQSGGTLVAAFGLAPVQPRMFGSVSSSGTLPRRMEWPAVDGTRPQLQWQAFPRERDSAAAPEDMARVRNVRYDLVIARERHLAVAEEVYRRESLPAPLHRLEADLQPGAYYFWTVRARFELDGRERVTEWATTHYLTFGRSSAPSRTSYRFRTPGESP